MTSTPSLLGTGHRALGTLHVLGIRHHGPGSAWMVDRALAAIKPDCVLIEGPPEAAEVLALAGSEDMVPPVALLVYDPEKPSDAAYWPFAGFSPEWRAIAWGLKHEAEVRFIDLPWAARTRDGELDADEDGGGAGEGEEGKELVVAAATPGAAEAETDEAPPLPPAPREDPLDALAKAAGFSDGEAWWGRMIEEMRGDHDPLAVFEGVREAMTAAREKLVRHDPDEP
ncbi:MAG TPA: DUF5682 family protein, partial [Phycisphaerales bacterium]|nr:DUF5682 family protein [Phycisphaerales bacterium]